MSHGYHDDPEVDRELHEQHLTIVDQDRLLTEKHLKIEQLTTALKFYAGHTIWEETSEWDWAFDGVDERQVEYKSSTALKDSGNIARVALGGCRNPTCRSCEHWVP